MKQLFCTLLVTITINAAHAGGNPEHVPLPNNYQSDFVNYDTRNRMNGKQVAVLYANQAATHIDESDKLADGATIVMEIYKPVKDENDKPKMGANGVFEKGKLAAIAVMQKRSDWDAAYSASERTENWGYAIYNADGRPKDNNLECAACHTPNQATDYMFSYSSLVDFVNQSK